jgi:hypothetical protein
MIKTIFEEREAIGKAEGKIEAVLTVLRYCQESAVILTAD